MNYKVIYKDHNNIERWKSFEFHYQAIAFADGCGFRFIRIETINEK